MKSLFCKNLKVIRNIILRMDSKNLWILMLVFILKEASSEEEIICMEPWTQIYRSCIYISTILKTQSKAAATCDTMGGYLLVISEVKERTGIVAELLTVFPLLQSKKHYHWWVGLELDAETAQWKWVSDEEFSQNLT
ncbi:CLC4C-like protein [Mya arenaria]|uniref:CLC4C-like protein n=2 Tax=Mya arenaria TaxID=6604 RepID=A0ABY7FV40_MYAAR|nr:CLC4C-like protein [Mya arenaria]